MRKEEKIMRNRQGKKPAWILALLAIGALTLTFQLGAVGVLAQTPADKDLDGFSDTLEDSGISLSGMSLAAYPNVNPVPKCAAGIPRDQCVDKATQDLFVIIQRATSPCPNPTSCGDPCGPPLFRNVLPYGSDIPMPSQYATTYNPLALVYPGSGGTTLGVTTHELQTSGTSQAIGGWYAVKILENLNPCSNYMGLAKFGVPYSGSSATVWPEKIMNWIDKTCGTACFDLDNNGTAETCYTPSQVASFTCKNANSTTSIDMKAATPILAPLYYEFLQYVISHEASHMMNLASGSGTSADHHYSILKGVLMEQSVLVTVSRSVVNNNQVNINVTLYISNTYTKLDKTQHKLK
jgi:hypothetical protein